MEAWHVGRSCPSVTFGGPTPLMIMRILLTLVAVVAFMASATAQDVTKEKKARKADKTEAVSTTEAAPKAGCCASKAGASAAAGKSCGSKAGGKADASAGAAAAEGATDAAAKAGRCHGLSDAEKKACCADKAAAGKVGCAGKAEAHNHDHGGANGMTEEDPATQPNH